MADVGVKDCLICHESKSLDAFPRSAARRDGRGPYCAPCRKAKYGDPATERNRRVEKPNSGLWDCRYCGETKPVSEFYWRSESGRFAYRCKACRRQHERSQHEANPQRRRAAVLRIKYGVSLADFDAMLVRQGGGCAICGATENPDAPSLAVDHDHVTGRVRGVLCGPCNKALGLFLDDPARPRAALAYLKAGD